MLTEARGAKPQCFKEFFSESHPEKPILQRSAIAVRACELLRNRSHGAQSQP